ncbi:hypothetical protein [Streptomyces sp. MMG1533]|uniref:hypothetical protein n=1 Tax=Streptomyces sp. MMG1533 TaxID=1415546 RepID=UPI001F48F61A|nr:hypothetical protein [Streptomyces sp. MMG1533]
MLCRRSGVPTAEVRGNVTSCRARSTIASRLYNAKEPMTLFELQEWLGHRTPDATTHYARLTPDTLARACNDAGCFARDVRTIEVLVGRGAVASGAAANGEPWQYFGLGRGWCTYTFLEQCRHRMACARCDFYAPKDSSRGRLLEAKENLQKMLASIPSRRRRTSRRRRRPGRPRPTPGTAHRCPCSRGADTTPARDPGHRSPAADRRGDIDGVGAGTSPSESANVRAWTTATRPRRHLTIQ